VSPAAKERMRFLFTVLGLAMALGGLGIEAGPWAVLGVAVIGAVPLAIGLSNGLRRRREREQSPPSPIEERDRARESYALLRWSPLLNVAYLPLLAVLAIWQFGISLGTVLMVAGLAIMVVNGIAPQRRIVRELRTKAALD
jgi:hypothetical protein